VTRASSPDSLKESTTEKLVQSYVTTTERVATVNLGQIRLTLSKKQNSIELGKGPALFMRQKLKAMKKTVPIHPSLAHIHIFQEPVNGKYPVFKHSCTFAEIQQLESVIGKFTRNGLRSIREKRSTDITGVLETPLFKITYTPSKFKLNIKFTHLSD